MTPIGFERHDHHHCIDAALDAVEAHCKANRLQLTTGRRQVMEILLREHRALGAYEILDLLGADGGRPRPPVAYRALDFLTAHGFVHRIERLNAFVACICPGQPHDPVFLICRNCAVVAEAQSRKPILTDVADEVGFAVERAVVEAEGLCPACQPTA